MDSLRTSRHGRLLNADRQRGRFAFPRRMIDRHRDFDAANDSAKRAELSIEMRTIADQDKKVRSSAVRFLAAGHRHDAPLVLHAAWFIGKMMSHALCEIYVPLLAGRKVAALNHKTSDDAAERRGVQRA